MGQRSQMYVRLNYTQCAHYERDDNGRSVCVPETPTTVLIAKYYGWNYGEYMLSRAKGVANWAVQNGKYLNVTAYPVKEFSELMDVNCDCGSVMLGGDILGYIKEYPPENGYKSIEDLNCRIFKNQDNNNGIFILDVNEKESKPKYCFVHYEHGGEGEKDDYNLDFSHPLTAQEYFNKDTNNGKYLDYDDNGVTSNNNIKFFDENCQLMTEKELQEFITADYSKQIGVEIADKGKDTAKNEPDMDI